MNNNASALNSTECSACLQEWNSPNSSLLWSYLAKFTFQNADKGITPSHLLHHRHTILPITNWKWVCDLQSLPGHYFFIMQVMTIHRMVDLVEYQRYAWYVGCRKAYGNSCQYFKKMTFRRSFLDHSRIQWLTNDSETFWQQNHPPSRISKCRSFNTSFFWGSVRELHSLFSAWNLLPRMSMSMRIHSSQCQGSIVVRP